MLRFLLCAITLFGFVGCGASEAPYTDTSQDPEAYAKTVKQLVMRQAARAKTSAEPADQLSVIVQELEQTDRPVGNYAATYTEILAEAKALQAECEQVKGKATKLGPKFDALSKKAESLPGEANVNLKGDKQ